MTSAKEVGFAKSQLRHRPLHLRRPGHRQERASPPGRIAWARLLLNSSAQSLYARTQAFLSSGSPTCMAIIGGNMSEASTPSRSISASRSRAAGCASPTPPRSRASRVRLDLANQRSPRYSRPRSRRRKPSIRPFHLDLPCGGRARAKTQAGALSKGLGANIPNR